MTFVNVGEVLAGKYRVDKVLGVGGMGMVVAATHLELDQRVALKFMLPEALESATAMDRFLREARAAVRLRSEHVCRVLDVGRLETGAPYIVMEYMEGRDFAAVLAKQGPLGVTETVDYLLQAIEGVAEAHANGIVHRDLKPGNLFVTTDSDGTPLVKVLDFGISKSSLGGEAIATKTGDFMGSPAYMAPEQMASAKHVDARADLWAMGVILYQTLTGTLPFEGETLPTLCMSVMSAPPRPPRTARPELPAALETIMLRCLEKDPAARYAHLGELAVALAAFGSPGSTMTATRITKVLRKSVPVIDAVAVAATMATAPPPMAVVSEAPPARASAVGSTSTLQTSAAEISVPSAPRSGGRRGLIAGVLGVVAIAIVVIVIASSGGGGTPSTSTSTQPAPPAASSVAPAPAVTPPAPPPPVETIEVAPPAAPAAAPVVVDRRPARRVPAKPPIQKPATKPDPGPPVAVEVKPEMKPPADPPKDTTPAKSKWGHMQHDKKPTQ